MGNLIDRVDGPTLHAALVGRAVEPSKEQIVKALELEIATCSRRLADVFDRAAQHIYAEGVRDGFTQGVAAADAMREEHSHDRT